MCLLTCKNFLTKLSQKGSQNILENLPSLNNLKQRYPKHFKDIEKAKDELCSASLGLQDGELLGTDDEWKHVVHDTREAVDIS